MLLFYLERRDDMIIKTEEELQKMKEISRIVALARDKMAASVRPGITTGDLDDICRKVLEENGAVSAPMSSYDFPGYSCISVNEVCAHGVPSDYVIKDGDSVNVDVSSSKDGFFSDTGRTVTAGKPDLRQEDMQRVSMEALYAGIKAARPGTRTSSIGKAIFKKAVENDYTVLMNLTGHGIGRALHEDPHYIFNYNEREGAEMIKENMVLAIETFISDGDEWIEENEDGSWPLYTENRSQIVQFEHTVVVRKEGNLILTSTEEFR